ncbi:MAG TPA: RIO1 family regulatory kinase/ATPase [Anaerolineales bacterium]|nr:RIO1 family regulatory kinase/ATPase [Anaerolineales bacterium]
MSKNQLFEYFDELDDQEGTLAQSNHKRVSVRRESKKRDNEARLFIRAQEFSRDFQFTYKAARFEEAWLLDSLAELADLEWISDVLRKVKGGKEASVYLCKGGRAADSPLVAAKIYRPRTLRNLKNDQQYRVGRADLDEKGDVIRDDRTLRATQKRTEYGEEVRHQSWIAYEFLTLETLYAAGADVPRPYAMERNAILMGYVGDVATSAPPLSAVDLDRDEAGQLFERVIRNIDLLLRNDRIHGDLSAYNILYWNGDVTLIDFPQVVAPEANPQAWNIFLRDVTRVCDYFKNQGVRSDPRALATELWTAYGHKTTKEVEPSLLDAEKPEDRKLWMKQSNKL